MAYIQSTASERAVYLTLADVPATTVAYNSVTVKYKKSGQGGFTVKTLTSTDWVNLGGGIYTLRFSAIEMDTLGDFLFTVSSVHFDNFVYDEFTIEPAPASGSGPTAPVGTCVVSGTLVNVQNLNPHLMKVVFKPVEFPARSGSTIVAADAVYTFPDAYGNFSVALVQGAVLLVEIERAGIRAQITVPSTSTANLLDLLPTLPISY